MTINLYIYKTIADQNVRIDGSGSASNLIHKNLSSITKFRYAATEKIKKRTYAEIMY